MEHDVWIAIISGLTTSIVPTVRIIVVWLQRKVQFDGVNQINDSRPSTSALTTCANSGGQSCARSRKGWTPG